MEKRSTTLPTFSKMVPVRGVEGSKRIGVLDAVIELIPNIEKVLGSAFGPNGQAILFAGDRSSHVSISSPVMSRTGLEIIEILSSKNDRGTVHPLLKSLVDTCRKLNAEWGDGVKSLVLIACELLRLCASLDSSRPSWLRMELQKVICCLEQISKSIEPSRGVKIQGCADSRTDDSKDRVKNFAVPIIDSRISSHEFEGYDQGILNQLEMFFATRFPPHICDVISPLLFKWVSSLEKNSSSLSLEYVVDNFNFLCHIDVGLSTDQSCLIKGVLFHGVGIGRAFEPERKNLCEGLINVSKEEHFLSGEIHSSSNYFEVKFVLEEELNNFKIFGKTFSVFGQCLCLTSSFVEESVESKINQFRNLSLIHSIPKEELDFIHNILQLSSADESNHAMKIEFIRRWNRRMARDSSMIWLKIPKIETLVLSVPTSGISEGLKNSCWNALQLISQFNYYTSSASEQGFGSAKDELDLSSSISCPTNSNLTFNDKSTAALNMLSERKELAGKDLPEFMFKNILIDSGGHAEILFHDMISRWWMSPPFGCKYIIDRNVTEAISKACLKIPRSLGKDLLRKPLRKSLDGAGCNHKELIAHRLAILQHAVSVVQAWSNISDVLCISNHSSLAKGS